MNNKKRRQKEKKMGYIREIDMNTFLNDYVSVCQDIEVLKEIRDLIKRNYRDNISINHYDLEELHIPGVVRVSIDDVYEEDLLRGEVLKVVANAGYGFKRKEVEYYRRPSSVLKSLKNKIGYDTDEPPLPSSYDLRSSMSKNKRKR